MIIVEEDGGVRAVDDPNEVVDVINKAKGRVVIVKVMDVGEDIIKSKCAGQIDDCLGEIVILRTSDPERIKHRKDVEVLDVFDLGGEYAVAVRASIDALIDIMGDEKVREAERDRMVHTL